MPTDVMLDIETLGTKPGCAIISIGMIAFDRVNMIPLPDPAAEFQMDVDFDSLDADGFTGSPSTIAWWMAPEQAPARAQVFDPAKKRHPVEIVAMEVSAFLRTYLTGCIWSKGNFDMPILAEFLKRAGRTAPWGFWQERDLRSFFDAMEFDKRAQGAVSRGLLTPHVALDDAIHQVAQMQAAASHYAARMASL